MDARARRDYKKGLTGDDGRRRREERSLAIRKDKKEEGLAKRRNLNVEADDPPNTEQVSQQPSAVLTEADLQSIPTNRVFTLRDVPTLMKGLQSGTPEVQTACLRGFRKLLSSERNPPVQECIDCGAVPLFVEALRREDTPQLQFEAAWALTNIASTDRTRLIVDCGALPALVQLLVSPVADIREQSAWCLGNVAGDGHALRDIVLKHDALAPLLQNIMNPANTALLRNCVWALSNFCRGKPQPPLEVLAPAMPVIANVILKSDDQDTIIDATWALSYISDGDNDRIQSVINLGVIPSLVNMLRSGQNPLAVPALRTLGNIVSGSDHQTQAVLDADVLAALSPLLTNAKKNIRKETCWMLSNIAAGTHEQITRILKTPDIVPRILEQMSVAAEWDVRKEATWVVSNIATGGQLQHVLYLVEHGAVRPVCDLLEVGEVKLVLLAMDAMEAILKAMGESDRAINLIEECGGIDKLESLQEHEDEGIYTRAVRILENYFGGEEEVESENLAPAVSAQNPNTFSFGLPAAGSGAKALNFGDNSAPNANVFSAQYQF